MSARLPLTKYHQVYLVLREQLQEGLFAQGLPAEMALAQQFVHRVVGLRAGAVVYDGPPEGLTPEILTTIYGEEDWTATQKHDDDAPLDGARDVEAALLGGHP